MPGSRYRSLESEACIVPLSADGWNGVKSIGIGIQGLGFERLQRHACTCGYCRLAPLVRASWSRLLYVRSTMLMMKRSLHGLTAMPAIPPKMSICA